MSDPAQEQSPEQRLEAFLEVEDTPAETPQETATEEQSGEQSSEQEQETPAEEKPSEAPRTYKFTHDGSEVEKSEEETIALARQGFDYTVKTQRLADERRAVEELSGTLKAQEAAFAQQGQAQQAMSQEIAKVTAIDLQLSQYEKVDWQALSSTDPVEAQKLFFGFTQLKSQREQAVAEAQRKQQEFLTHQATARQKALEAGRQVLAKEIPGWNSDVAKSLVDVGKTYGFTDQELSNLTDPRAVKLLHDAAQWRKLQTKPAQNQRVPNNSPPVKPGANNTKNAASAAARAERQALKETGRGEHAAKLIERML